MAYNISTMDDPSKYGFIPDHDERILRIIHRHPVTLIPPITIGAVMFILGLFLVYVSARYGATIPFGTVLALVLGILLGAMGVAAVLVSIYVFNRNALIFTSLHLIQSEQAGLFNHRISQINFARVQDVTGNKIGIWQSLFNFGNVEVQSAAEQEKFIFRSAPHPAQLADDALQTRDICLHDAAMRDATGPQAPAAAPSSADEEE